MYRNSVKEQKRRLEIAKRKFDDLRSKSATCKGKMEAALSALEKFGVKTPEQAGKLAFRARRKKDLLERDLERVLRELEEELEL